MPSSDHARPDTAPELVIDCMDEEAIDRAAAAVARCLPRRIAIALQGDLGAGKTTFVKRLAAAVGIDPRDVTSPTFGLVHLHDVPGDHTHLPVRLVHVDAYRLADASDVATIGWDELVADDGWLAVEWADRIVAMLPKDRIDIRIEILGPRSRRLHLSSAERPDVVSLVAAETRHGD